IPPEVAHQAVPRAFPVGQEDRGDLDGFSFRSDFRLRNEGVRAPRIEDVSDRPLLDDPTVLRGRCQGIRGHPWLTNWGTTILEPSETLIPRWRCRRRARRPDPTRSGAVLPTGGGRLVGTTLC